MELSLQLNIIPISTSWKEAYELKGIEKYFPNKIVYSMSEADLPNYPGLINQLIEKVYQFSRMNWKSISQQNLSVIIKYPEMVAEIYPYSQHDKLPDFGKESLWFL